jgi:acyl-CoA thioester hydrolase
MKHVVELKTRSYECDSYGHINNATYLNYLEYARIELLDKLPVPHDELRRRGIGFVVTRICIDYRMQVASGVTLRIETRSIRKERVRVVFKQEIFRDDRLVAEAEVTWACIDEQGKPIRIPPVLDIPELEPETNPAAETEA